VNIWDLCLPYAIGLMATLALLQTRATSMPRPEVIQTLVLCSLIVVGWLSRKRPLRFAMVVM